MASWTGLPPRTVRPWSDPLARHGVMSLEGPGHLVFYPRSQIAMVREEQFGRVEVLSATGELGHHPGPLSALAGPPFVQAAPGVLRNPCHRQVEGGWELPPVPEAPPPEPGSEVLYLRSAGRDTILVTDSGERRVRGPSRAQAALLPGALRFGHAYLNPGRLRRIRMESDSSAEAVLDEGTLLRTRPSGARSVMRALDVDTLRWLPAANQAQAHLSAARLRNWPLEIAAAPADWLRAEFEGDPERLIANLAWQSVLSQRCYGESHRSLYYTTVLPLLEMARAPLFTVPESEREYLRYCGVLADLVMARRLFTFRDLGFQDMRPDLRGVGDRLPHVVLFVEKGTRDREVALLRETFGMSFVIGGGRSFIVGSEFLAEKLLPILDGRPVIVLALVDFDPWGWIAADAFVAQLGRYGVATGDLRHLILPRRFTEQELRERCTPLPQTDATLRTVVRLWVARSGGIGGRALGISSDQLDGERLVAAVGEELGAAR